MKNNYVILIVLFAVLVLVSCDLKEAEITTDYSDIEVKNMMQGFWHLTGYKGSVDEAVKLEGTAMDIDGDEITFYSRFQPDSEQIDFSVSGGNVVKYTYNDESYEMDSTFKTKDGYELMILRGDGETLKFEKTTYDAYYLYKGISEGRIDKYSYSIYLEDELTDEQLFSYIAEIHWKELYYLYTDGTTGEMDPYALILYKYGLWGTSQFDADVYYVDWEVANGELIVTYSGDESYYFPIDYVYDKEAGYAYLYLYNTDQGQEGNAWVLWSQVSY